ncbi:adenylate/guanylate cyclase with GAF sensor(s) [[Phormidium ambiguum] IAM M-71]|uniref:Adenylate cyclase n=1 Tax=[Phormidium ambiguum] IAM M-71 TaxID=454136 RepID=A0A1U7IT13_9CYAN|nr:adenylate/guanylate cyclase domain-containing protein [Phormidium ambiguum]OKH40565.1 adenylate/guanylate cyclase with GAF sensor(s) [Phormidium ambiguum IAM M-71]
MNQQQELQNNLRETANILIVDDTPDNLRLLSTMLSGQGYCVRKAINGQMALKATQMSAPDLILLDINMPMMNGYEVCQALKSHPQTCKIPVIFISALDQVIDKIKAFEVGGVDYITKPFQLEEVLARINNQLNQKRLSEQLEYKNQQLQAEISDRKQAEVKISLLLAATQAINHADNFDTAIEEILHLICKTIGWDFGEAWIPDDDRQVLECSPGWYASEPNLEIFRQKSLLFTFPPNIGLPGRIWVHQQTEWIENLTSELSQDFSRQEIAVTVGLNCCFGVPILLSNEVLAILVFFKKGRTKEEVNLLELVNAVATQLGSLIQRKRAEEALRLAEQRYHSIVENAVDGIFQTTPSGRYISANAALAKIYGYDSPEELIAVLSNISHQLYVDVNRRQEFVNKMEKDHAVYGFESLIRRKDGKVIWISENARSVRDSTGKLLYYEGIVSDITVRKVALEALRYQQEQAEKLLLNILPEPIAQRLKLEQNTIADSFESVTVLFADLVGFTELSANTSPQQLVENLNIVFSEFDILAEQYGLEKIKTIGDAYMAVAGLPASRPDHAEAAAEMALGMLIKLTELNTKTNTNFSLRIGMNTGPVVAGVIGIKKFSYDLWGDTVNIASRMESQGIPGAIQVSTATYKLLKTKYQFTKRGSIPIKGKGEMVTYLLTGRNQN